MADRNIKKETKKPKKSDKKVNDNAVSSADRPVMMQPELIKKEKNRK
ncbi:MAG: hypothetical protein RRY54_01190 [Angelakisella sp.]